MTENEQLALNLCEKIESAFPSDKSWLGQAREIYELSKKLKVLITGVPDDEVKIKNVNQ